jgi:hypothetical protein
MVALCESPYPSGAVNLNGTPIKARPSPAVLGQDVRRGRRRPVTDVTADEVERWATTRAFR